MARSDEVDESKAIEIAPADDIGFIALARTLFATYPQAGDPRCHV